MNKKIAAFLLIVNCSCLESQNPKDWNEAELSKWYASGDWKSGWKIAPDESNKKEFSLQYFRNKERWNHAFTFLSTTDLSKIALGKHELDGSNLYVSVDEYLTKDEENTRFEAHRKYADIQYVISGKEQIGISPLKNTKEVVPYDSIKDVVFLKAVQNNYRMASPNSFFIFFPEDAHRPGLKVTHNSTVRKIVVKVRIN